MKESKLEIKILKVLKLSKRPFMSKGFLLRKSEIPRNNRQAFIKTLREMEQKGKVVFTDGKYALPERLNLVECEMTKVSSGYGFAETEEERFFIPGRLLKGAMVGDFVLVREISHNGASPEGEVVKIVKDSNEPFVATVKELRAGFGLVPDNMPSFVFKVKFGQEKGIKEGDKVSATIFEKADNHFDHVAKIEKIYGKADRAQVCAWAILDQHKIKKRFDKATLENAKEVFQSKITKEDRSQRVNLTKEVIFTIDSAESKDLDDAISIKKTKQGYELGVHIADVSHFVKPKSPLDNEAFERGTSVYYADQVIPMLPKEISNGICSLNPHEEKLTFSAIMQLDEDGCLVSYKFQKTIINSNLKGVYKEINQILSGVETPQISEKYKDVREAIFLLDELCNKLIRNREKRHALEIESDEAKFIIDQGGDPVDIIPRQRGKSERIIEECMVLANEAAARVSMEAGVPFLYRVHQRPGEKKLTELISFLRIVGINPQNLQKAEITPADIGSILKKVQGKPLAPVVNMQVLRSMEKARYSVEEIGHFGLALDFYSHFTSPIRRYPDLVIHRVLSDIVAGDKIPDIVKRYTKFMAVAAKSTSRSEVQAVEAERDCEDAYKAQFMTQFVGDIFEAKIVSVTNFGLYVALSNTVEGLVRVEQLPQGSWIAHEGYAYREAVSSRELKLGDQVKVKLIHTDVSLGQIDFSMKDLETKQ